MKNRTRDDHKNYEMTYATGKGHLAMRKYDTRQIIIRLLRRDQKPDESND